MLSNNALAPSLQQRLQRAIVAYAENDAKRGEREIGAPLAEVAVLPGSFRLSSDEAVEVLARGNRRSVRREGVDYPAYPIGAGIRYVPGLDLYIAGAADGGLRWLTLYEDVDGKPAGTAADATAAKIGCACERSAHFKGRLNLSPATLVTGQGMGSPL